jgi:hypothetical protein
MKTPKSFHPHILLAISPVDRRLRHVPARARERRFDRSHGHSAAKARIYGGFACIHEQIGGGTPQKAIPPPYFIEDLQLAAGGPAVSRRSSRPSLAAALPCAATAARAVAVKLPIKYGSGSDLSPRCHPVPPFHPERHALLDDRPELRVMAGPGERFLHGEQTETDREGAA